MIKIFRKIRQKLLTENKFNKYLIYAIGEIVLVVIGILIALQINNWNLEKKQDQKFKIAIEQIYTHIHSAIEMGNSNLETSKEQLEICKNLQKDLDSYSNVEVLKLAYYLDWIPGTGFRLLNFNDFLNKIEFDGDDSDKSSLLFHLNQFFILITDGLANDYNNYKVKYFEPIFFKNHIPLSSGQVNRSIRNAKQSESPLLNDSAIKKIDSLKTTTEFLAALLSTEERLTKIIWVLEFEKSENKATMEMLLSYDSDLNLKYDKLVLVGNAIPDGNKIDMKLIDEKKGEWAISTEFNKGTIIFKSDYANYFYWGSDGVSNSKLKFWGTPINVKSGRHEIIINLENMTFKIDEK